MRRFGLALVMLALLGSEGFAADPKGNWLVSNKQAVIKIDNCGAALCGTIASSQVSGLDSNNPDPAKRNRSIVGVTILLSMKQTAENRWDGQIYNPENGKIYEGYIVLNNPNDLRIQGCVLGFLCGGENWT